MGVSNLAGISRKISTSDTVQGKPTPRLSEPVECNDQTRCEAARGVMVILMLESGTRAQGRAPHGAKEVFDVAPQRFWPRAAEDLQSISRTGRPTGAGRFQAGQQGAAPGSRWSGWTRKGADVKRSAFFNPTGACAPQRSTRPQGCAGEAKFSC